MNRYDSYKDSGVEWIGEIPSHWNTKRFSYSFNVQKGKIPKFLTNEKDIDSYPYLSMSVLRGEEPLEFTKEDGLVFVDEGDIGLLWDGSNSGEVLKINKKGILSSTVSHLSLIDDNLYKNFTFYLLKFYERDFKNNTVGMGIPHVDGVYVKESKVLIPPLSEQQQIVSFLDSKTSQIDEIIQKKERKIELLKEYRTSLIYQVVTKGLNPNVEMKDSGVEWIGEIPSHWGMVKLKQLFTINKRISGELGFDVLSVTQRGLRVKDLENNEGQHSMDYSKYQLVFEGDFVMNHMDLLTGYVDVSKGTGVTSPDYRVYTQSVPNLNQHYYLNLFQLCYKRRIFYGLGRGVSNLGRWRLPSSEFLNMYIPFPSENEQNQIVSFFEDQTSKIDSFIQTEERKIELLKEYRLSLVSSVVTGKIDVRTN
jgi:type I restriction enzyme S subunit